MNTNLHNKDFEQFLRDSVEEFRMIPRERVWYSLYNNLHPGSKWPSLSMGLLLLTALLFIGISNNNHINRKVVAANNAKSLIKVDLRDAASTNVASNEPHKNNTEKSVLLAEAKSNNLSNPSYLIDAGSQNALATTSGYDIADVDAWGQGTPELATTISNQPAVVEMKIGEKLKEMPILQHQKKLNFHINQNNNLTLKNGLEENDTDDNNQSFLNLSKLKDKSTFTYYITPSVGFRKLNNEQGKNTVAVAPGASMLMASPAISDDNTFNQSASINVEAGAAVAYKLNEHINAKAGIQLNYTNYNIHALALDHPVETALLLENENGGNKFVRRTSSLANPDDNSTDITLQSQTYQISIPFGVEMKILENGRIGWYAATSLQPTRVISGSSYLLSYDTKNYLEDGDYLRKWNLNVGAETYLGYMLKNGVQLNFGPQYRQQIFSTYSNNYKINERLYNLGIKLGVTKKF